MYELVKQQKPDKLMPNTDSIYIDQEQRSKQIKDDRSQDSSLPPGVQGASSGAGRAACGFTRRLLQATHHVRSVYWKLHANRKTEECCEMSETASETLTGKGSDWNKV